MQDWYYPLQILLLLLAHGLSWLAVGHALLTKQDPRSALGWVVTALFLPGLGALLYVLFGIRRSDSRAARLMRDVRLDAFPERPRLHGGADLQTPPGDVPDASLPGEYAYLAHIGQKLTGRRVCGGNTITPLFNGEEAYPVMLDAINRARGRVFLSTYIFNAGDTGAAFCRALADAARRGCDVRVLVDGVGCQYSLSKPWRALKRQGVRTALFLPPRLWRPSLALNLRNHRKVLVCDGTGFTGGMNIADAHKTRYGGAAIHDIHYRCVGPLVAQLQEAFLLDWAFSTGEHTPAPVIIEEQGGSSLCRMLLDGPGSGADLLHDVLCTALTAARRRIRVMTPYFLPTHELMSALRTAALRGVDVQVILPGKNNLPYVHWACLHLLRGLVPMGVRVFFRPPPFAHTKLLLLDDAYVQIGSANLDPRSLRLNFELNVEVFDPLLAARLRAHFAQVRRTSREIDGDALRDLPLLWRLRNAACWLFSPYL